MSKILIWFIVGFSGLTNAHQDTPLSFKGGKIVGLPERYSPASFDKRKMSLKIKGKELVFPKVLRNLLMADVNDDPFGGIPKMEPHPYQYHFSSSWYHEDLLSSLPPYILMTIKPEGDTAYFELLIDMDKLEFIDAELLVKKIGRVPIDLDGIPDKPSQESDQKVRAPEGK